MARILVVDDEAMNRAVLRATFAEYGHEIVEAAGGHDALALAEEHPPDLVLLDVMMPDLDGYETTRELKAMFAETLVPVILVTALEDRDSRVRGLAAGADEFLTKPIDRDELLVRVGNLLQLRAREVELLRRNVELVELRRFQEDTMAMLVHDLKSPLAVILASIDQLAAAGLDEQARETLDDSRRAGARIARLVANILEAAHAESGRLIVRRGPVPVPALVETVLGPRGSMIERRDLAIEVDVEGHAVDGDRDLLARVVENLVDNALRYTPASGRIRLWAGARDEVVELRVGNTGAAIPEPTRALVFEKYTQVFDSRRGSVGLGLYFCRLAIEAHGGRIWIEETPDLPTVFAISLPRAGPGARV